jgi:hypothetical protein
MGTTATLAEGAADAVASGTTVGMTATAPVPGITGSREGSAGGV